MLDEPVVGLDPPSQALLHELLVERKRAGTAVLLTTHQMAFADGLADRARPARGGRGGRRGPVDRGARARGGAGWLAVASTAARRAARATCAPGGGRATRRRASASGSTSSTRARSWSAILGALAYGTASSALAQVVTPRLARRAAARRSRCSRVLLATHWGAYQGPVVFSVADVALLLGAPLPRRGLAVRRLVLALARRRGGGRGRRRRR